MPFNSRTMAWERGDAAPAEPETEVEPGPANELAAVVADLSVPEVIDLINSGEATLEDVLVAEEAGKKRKTVLSLVMGENGTVYPKTS